MKRESHDGRRVYQGSSEVCAECPLQSRCCQSAKGEGRTITTDDKEALRQQMNAKMATEPAKAIYGKRKTIVEPVFGQIKNSGFRGFSVRGVKNKLARVPLKSPGLLKSKSAAVFFTKSKGSKIPARPVWSDGPKVIRIVDRILRERMTVLMARK